MFVEKKQEHNVEGNLLKKEIREYLGINSLREARIVNVYEMENGNEEIYSEIIDKVLSEPNLDNVYEDNMEIAKEDKYFGVEFLPGQYNQR